jgi:radical SAM family uncharacterized protein
MLDQDILLQAAKPARYIGQEWNSVKKDLSKVDIKIALCFPDVYEIGMSHLGIRILYGLLNRRLDVACERVFAPWIDMENILTQRKIPLSSIESGLPLRDFDIIGFSLQSELNYSNVLNILHLAGIPLKSEERTTEFPLVIAGGICCLNPEPISEFIDAFCIGDAEEMILEIVDILKRVKKGLPKRVDKDKLLSELAGVEGVYVPSLYEVRYYLEGTLRQFRPKDGAPRFVRKRILPDLDNAYFPEAPIVPYVEIVHDRVTIELMRGCPHRCRFCQAQSYFYPLRKRSQQTILKLAKESIDRSGYEQISLASLSSADYPGIDEIILKLIELFGREKISISVSSLRPSAKVDRLPGLLSKIKKTGLTFAPEAATERLRRVIGKPLDMVKFEESLRHAYKTGYHRLKLYFMIGLPTETEEDLDGIIDLTIRASQWRKEVDGRPAVVTASVASFIPKPHTPFQWLPMLRSEQLLKKQDYLRIKLSQTLRRKGAPEARLRFTFHNVWTSLLEACFSRGDRRLNSVLLSAWSKGARFDSWSDCLRIDVWISAFKESGLDPAFFANRQFGLDELLPWDHIESGQGKESLKEEFKEAMSAVS